MSESGREPSGGGVDTYADGSYDFGHEEVNEGFPTSPYDQSLEAQMDEAPDVNQQR